MDHRGAPTESPALPLFWCETIDFPFLKRFALSRSLPNYCLRSSYTTATIPSISVVPPQQCENALLLLVALIHDLFSHVQSLYRRYFNIFRTAINKRVRSPLPHEAASLAWLAWYRGKVCVQFPPTRKNTQCLSLPLYLPIYNNYV